jgi:hypothetical protein
VTRDLALKILGALLLAALAVALVFGTVKGYEHWRDAVRAEGDAAGAARVQALWDKDIEKHDADTLKKVAEARADEQRMAADAAKGEADARRRAEERAQAQAAAARAASAAAGGLRDDLAALDGAARALGIPDAASCPGEFARQRTKPSEREPFSARARGISTAGGKTLMAPLPASSSASTPR